MKAHFLTQAPVETFEIKPFELQRKQRFVNNSSPHFSLKILFVKPHGVFQKNAALFLRLGLLSTLIPRKRSSNWRNLKTPSLRSSVEEKHFKTRAFWKRWHYDYHVTSLAEVFSNTNSKWPPVIVVFTSLRRSTDGKHLMHQWEWKHRFKLLQRFNLITQLPNC